MQRNLYEERRKRERQKARQRACRIRKRKKRMKLIFLSTVALAIVLCAICALWAIRETRGEGAGSGAFIQNQIRKFQAEKMLREMDVSDEYTEELKNLLKKNPETIGFVKYYNEKKDDPPADSVGTLENGKIPLLLQWDERWGYGIYVDNMIAVNGCGPTAVAMVASGLTGDDSITPYRVAQSAAEQGYYEDGVGTSWQFMTEGVQQYGIYGEEMALSENTVFTALENGQPIICSMGAGDFTTTGHFIVLTGVEDGKIIVNDPNSKEKSEKRWEYERLESQIQNLWVYDLF